MPMLRSANVIAVEPVRMDIDASSKDTVAGYATRLIARAIREIQAAL